MSEKRGLDAPDLLGITPVARALERVTDSVLSGAEALLGRICLPAAEEFGLLLRDKVSRWRQQNVLSTVARAQPLLQQAASDNRHAPPRLIMESLNYASWADHEEVQQMWAGLLASSCTLDGEDDSNWIFINLLAQLTAMQARILNFSSETAEKRALPSGLIVSRGLARTADELVGLTGCTDIQRIYRELNHLCALGLIQFAFSAGSDKQAQADIRPTSLALHLYIRAQGSLESPMEYFSCSAADAPDVRGLPDSD
jgi:hypothetical protein